MKAASALLIATDEKKEEKLDATVVENGCRKSTLSESRSMSEIKSDL